MPCLNCGFILLLYENEIICPKCEQLALLDSVAAVEVSNKRLDHVKKLWADYVKTLDKQSLLAWVVWEREKYSRNFIEKYQPLDLGKLFAYTLLLKRTMQVRSINGTTAVNNEESAKEMISLFNKLTEIELDHFRLEAGYYNMLYLKKFDLDNLTPEHYEDFITVPNEKFLNLMKTYDNHDILTREEGAKRVKQYGLEFAEVLRGMPNQPRKSYSVEEFTRRFYDLISAMYAGLLRNRLYAETFDLRPYKDLIVNPARLMEFVNSFKIAKDKMSCCDENNFLLHAEKFFKKRGNKLAKLLLFDDNNPLVFPLFVRVKGNSKDYIFISHVFSFLIKILLHAILTKDLFDDETEKRSREFENKEVKNEFEKHGLTYNPNLLDNKHRPTLEIDGIAAKDDRMYVVECKAWRLPSLVEESTTRNHIVRDLKGIVDGVKYRDQKGLKKKSLLEKIEFVDKNMQIWNFKREDFRVIQGVIVTMDYPPISDYRGVKIISLKEIADIL